MQLLDGKIASAAILQKIKSKTAAATVAGKRKPHLAAILIGNDGASETYVASKVKTCTEIGFDSTLIRFSNDIAEKELLQKIEALNLDPHIDGILVQLPLPKHIAEEKIIHAIAPHKDVDGFHPYNVGMMTSGAPTFIPATPYGILLMLEHYQIPTKGKHAVVIGRSHIVGTPMSILLSRKGYPGDCTVTLCHSATTNLKEIALQADILIAALGKTEFITADMVKPGAVIIDVGITRVEDSSKKSGFAIKGDVKFDEVAPIASAITPVPGGVGLMTIAGLMMNTWNAYQKHIAA
ncbi:MAG: bifunctional 5,10-methylene-tetrahydrofolate dehydrogenase/5,10-methylene-tetrahydrofolate cyclohydrolase [Bacteroidetes bacterium]|nr:bifunctional 5,10-methylene-tetrahydrofolate dehydrogenase/5,10-methylene-tetrahydrofolate cyclohydrolase [Bacteroidota bacterium]